MSKWSVAIADDNERMVEILDGILRQDEELQIVGIARNGEEACRVIKEKEPDIVLLDIIMPKLDGLTVKAGICRNICNWAGENYRKCISAGRQLLHYEAI